MVGNISSQLCSVECGDFGSLPVKQRGVWKHQTVESPTCLSTFKVKMQSPLEIEEMTNLISSVLYHDSTDIIPVLVFSNNACCIQLQSCSINPNVYNYWINILHLITSTF